MKGNSLAEVRVCGTEAVRTQVKAVVDNFAKTKEIATQNSELILLYSNFVLQVTV
jgi:hypothetical protein